MQEFPAHTLTVPRAYDGAVFDLDGTLLDTLADIGNAANEVLRQHGFPTHPIAAYRNFVGEGVRILMKRALPEQRRDEATLDACLKTMAVEYQRHLNQSARPYPGVTEVLRQLQTLGLRLAVLSNKPDEYTRPCVTEFFGEALFDPILGLRPGRPRKPDPDGALEIAASWAISPDRLLYLGDSGTDMQTASAAGMNAVGVLWGYRDETELVSAGARWLIRHPSELLPRPMRSAHTIGGTAQQGRHPG